MAHFYGRLIGNRNGVTRCGTRASGLYARLSGWCVGVNAAITYSPAHGLRDLVTVDRVPGSSSVGTPFTPFRAMWQEGDSEIIVVFGYKRFHFTMKPFGPVVEEIFDDGDDLTDEGRPL